MVAERLALLDRAEPALQVRQRWPVGDELPKAKGDEPDRNVAHRELVAGDVSGLAELRIQNLHRRGRVRLRRRDGGMVALLRRRADQAPEHGVDRGCAYRQLPV